MISKISIYQSNRYPFSQALIGSRNLRYPRLLVDFEAEVKMTGSVHAKNRKKNVVILTLLFFHRVCTSVVPSETGTVQFKSNPVFFLWQEFQFFKIRVYKSTPKIVLVGNKTVGLQRKWLQVTILKKLVCTLAQLDLTLLLLHGMYTQFRLRVHSCIQLPGF